MSWWDTGEGDDVIGDSVADLMGNAVGSFSVQQEQKSGKKPDLQQLADSFLEALMGGPLDMSQKQSVKKLTLQTSDGKRIVANPGNSNEEMVHPFQTGFQKIAERYQERWNRNPRATELTEALSFVLGYQPERYLSGPGSLEIEEMIVE